MIYWLQIKGLVATGAVAAFGICLWVGGFEYYPRWRDRLGMVILGGIFVIPFVTVAVSVWWSWSR